MYLHTPLNLASFSLQNTVPNPQMLTKDLSDLIAGQPAVVPHNKGPVQQVLVDVVVAGDGGEVVLHVCLDLVVLVQSWALSVFLNFFNNKKS